MSERPSERHIHKLCFGIIEEIGVEWGGFVECCECSGHECHNGIFDHMLRVGIHPQEMTPQAMDDAYETGRMDKKLGES